MLNNNKISGIYILTNPVIYKWPNRVIDDELPKKKNILMND
jgi:hypothetical protein